MAALAFGLGLCLTIASFYCCWRTFGNKNGNELEFVEKSDIEQELEKTWRGELEL